MNIQERILYINYLRERLKQMNMNIRFGGDTYNWFELKKEVEKQEKLLKEQVDKE